MPRRSWLRNHAEYWAAAGILKLIEWAPLPAANALALGTVKSLDVALPRLRRTAGQNLALALPGASEAERKAIADGVFRSMARVLVTVAKLPSIQPRNLDRWIRFEGYEHFEAAKRAGHGVLFATAHLGNWELSALAHGWFAGPMNVVVRPLDNPLLDRFIERRRALSGNQVLSKHDLARPILRALAANQAVGVLIDQNVMADSGVFVDFFGMPAATSIGFARLAARSGTVVLPGFALWSEKERRYVLRLYPPVPMTGDAERDTQSLQSRLEAVIRAYPDQWLWVHRRWKTRPAGAPPLYKTSPVGRGAV